LCALALLAVGCGDGTNPPITPEQAVEHNLTQVGELCRNYQFTKKKPPEKLSDLRLLQTMSANGYEALRRGDIVLLYNARLPDLAEEPGQTETPEILAYAKQVPVSGGPVLMLNRKIRTMTPEEFKAAPRPAGAKEETAEPAAKK